VSSADLAGESGTFERNVFVNCPFDAKYLQLLRPLLFTIAILGYQPRIAAERSDSGESRLDKICELIRQSKFSIHDLSRLKAARASELYRMNMPFELGIDYGTRQHGPEFMRRKKHLILGRDLHDFKKALSDLSGVDIKSHQNKRAEIVRAVRDWFYETVGVRDAPYPKVIWFQFNHFTTSLYEARLAEGIPEKDVREDIAKMPIPEYLSCVADWVARKNLHSEHPAARR
jgi:hypothetical protein